MAWGSERGGERGGLGVLGMVWGCDVSKGMCVLGSCGTDIGFRGSMGCLRGRGGGEGWAGVSRDNGRVWDEVLGCVEGPVSTKQSMAVIASEVCRRVWEGRSFGDFRMRE